MLVLRLVDDDATGSSEADSKVQIKKVLVLAKKYKLWWYT